MIQKYATCSLVLIAWVLAFAQTLEAGQRRFTFIYESTTSPKGQFELENWVTWKNGKESGNKVEFRHEIEYGITDRLQAALYVADWEVNDSKAGGDKGAHAAFQDTALELIYSLSNPIKDILGSALYGEFKIGPEHIELESRIILQKNFGPIIVAYNAVLEAEWEGEDAGVYDEQKGVFEQTFGVSYQFNPYFLVGGELLHEIAFPEWSDVNDSIVYIGPNASFRYSRFWVTTTVLLQVTGFAMNRSCNYALYLVWSFDFRAFFRQGLDPIGRFGACSDFEFWLPIAHVDGSCCVASDGRVCER